MAWAQDSGSKDLEKLVEQQGEQIEQMKGELSKLKAGAGKTARENEIEDYLDDTEKKYRRMPTVFDPQRTGWGERVRLGGYFSLEYRDEDGKSSEFDFHRLVLRLQADIADGISFDTEIEFEGGGADVGFLDGNEILVEYAELQFELLEDKINFTVGAILMPWGRFNIYHDDPLNDLTDRPIVSRYIGATAFGQPGVGFYGTVGNEAGWFLDYKIAWVQGFGEEFTTANGARSARQSYRSDNNSNKAFFGRFVLSVPWQALDVFEVGGSATWGKWSDDNQLANYGYALELFVKRGPWELIAEYMWMKIEQASGAPASNPRNMDGWYIQVNYHFFPNSWRGKHKLLTDESTFTLVVRVEDLDTNHDTSGTEFRDGLFQTTLGLNFRPVERTVWKFDFVWIDSEQDGSPEYRFLMSWATYF
jgi:hypothetical protein